MRNDSTTVRPIDANALHEAAETCRETTDAFQELIDAQPTLSAAQERTTRMLRKYSRPNVFADLWLHCEACGGVVSENPMNRVDKIKFSVRHEEAFKTEDVELMRAELKTWREKAIFEVLLSTGCRVSELVNIMIDDINGEEITVLGKGEKYRTVYLNAKARLAVERYLNERRDANPYLFPRCKFATGTDVNLAGEYAKRHKGEKGGNKNMADWYQDGEFVDDQAHMDISGVRQLVSRVGKKAGVENVHPHRFRRTCATHALQKGMPLELVSKMLGHNQLDTTKIYLTLNEEDLRYAHKKYVN